MQNNIKTHTRFGIVKIPNLYVFSVQVYPGIFAEKMGFIEREYFSRFHFLHKLSGFVKCKLLILKVIICDVP